MPFLLSYPRKSDSDLFGAVTPSVPVRSAVTKWLSGTPYNDIQVIRDWVRADQKTTLIVGVSQLLIDVLGKLPQTTHIVIQEIESNNWGCGGQQVSKLRKPQSNKRTHSSS